MNKENLKKALELIEQASKLLTIEYQKEVNQETMSADLNKDEVIVLSDVIGSVADAQGQLRDMVA
jgi:hypothetical protein